MSHLNHFKEFLCMTTRDCSLIHSDPYVGRYVGSSINVNRKKIINAWCQTQIPFHPIADVSISIWYGNQRRKEGKTMFSPAKQTAGRTWLKYFLISIWHSSSSEVRNLWNFLKKTNILEVMVLLYKAHLLNWDFIQLMKKNNIKMCGFPIV